MATYNAHRGWRVRYPGITGDGYINIGELIIFDRGMNRLGVSGSGFTLIQSGNYGGTTYDPPKAFDGNNGTLWSGGANGDPGGAWLGILYDDPVSVGGLLTANGGTSGVIEYSDDGVSWTAAIAANTSNYTTLDGFTETKATSPKTRWRCFVFEIQNNSYASVGEIDFRAGGASIDKTGGAPFSDQALGGYPNTNAFDGNPSSFWLSEGRANPSIGYQFATAVLPTELKIQNRNDGYGPSESWKTFAVQYSDDGVTWFLHSFFESLAWGANEQKTFDLTLIRAIPAYLQIWRLRNTAWSDNGLAISVSKMTMRETSGGADVTGAGTPYVQNGNPSYPPSNAFDANNSTFWITNSPGGMLGYDFGAEQVIAEYTIRSREGYGNEGPKSWVFEASDGEEGWITLDTRVGEASWASGETRTYSFTPPDGGGGDPDPVGRRRYTFCA